MNQVLLFYANIPSGVIAIVLAMLLIAASAGRWQLTRTIDAGLIGIYLWRPSLGMLVAVMVLYSIRWSRALAREVVLILGAEHAQGWTRHFLLLLLPSLVRNDVVAAPQAHATTGATERLSLPAAVAGEPIASSAATTPRTLRQAEWLHAMNDDPTAPNLGVIGPVRHGKTTLALALLGQRRGQFVITTPKAEDTDPWGGFAAVRLRIDLQERKVDWRPITDAIRQVHFEMLRRNATNSIASSDWITLVIDELATTFNAAPDVRKDVIDLWLMGPSSRVRLIVINPDANVRAWGIEGRRDILDSLLFAKVQAGREWALGRLDANGRLIDPVGMDGAGLLALAGRAFLSGREWAGLSPWVPPGGDKQSPVPPTQTADPATRPMATDDELVALIRQGLTREEIAQHLAIHGKGLDNNRLAELRAKLGLGRRTTKNATV